MWMAMPDFWGRQSRSCRSVSLDSLPYRAYTAVESVSCAYPFASGPSARPGACVRAAGATAHRQTAGMRGTCAGGG